MDDSDCNDMQWPSSKPYVAETAEGQKRGHLWLVGSNKKMTSTWKLEAYPSVAKTYANKVVIIDTLNICEDLWTSLNTEAWIAAVSVSIKQSRGPCTWRRVETKPQHFRRSQKISEDLRSSASLLYHLPVLLSEKRADCLAVCSSRCIFRALFSPCHVSFRGDTTVTGEQMNSATQWAKWW